jgi:hypothetical protein
MTNNRTKIPSTKTRTKSRTSGLESRQIKLKDKDQNLYQTHVHVDLNQTCVLCKSALNSKANFYIVKLKVYLSKCGC